MDCTALLADTVRARAGAGREGGKEAGWGGRQSGRQASNSTPTGVSKMLGRYSIHLMVE